MDDSALRVGPAPTAAPPDRSGPAASTARAIPRSFALAAGLGAIGVVAADAISPHAGDGAPALAAAVIAHPDRWMVGYSVQILGALLLLAGVLGFAWVASGRGARLVRVGVGVLVVGLVGFACQAATELMLVPVTADGASPAALETVHRMDQSAALVVVFLLYLPGMFFGPLLLAAGLARSRRTTWTVAGALGVATVAAFGLSGSMLGTLVLAVQMALLVALAAGLAGRRR